MNINRLLPWTVAAGLGVVIATHGALAFFGQGSTALDPAAEENAPGWTGKLHFRDRGDESGQIVFDLADRAGKPLTGLAVKALALRADESMSDVLVVMHESSPGRYVGEAVLDQHGRWEILASAQRAPNHFELSRQITVK